MDESVINGANLFFPAQIGIPQTGPDASRNQWLLGLVNGAPYVRSSVYLFRLPPVTQHSSSFAAVSSRVG